MAADETISLSEAARRAGVSETTLKRWASQKVLDVERGRWTPAAAAQARVDRADARPRLQPRARSAAPSRDGRLAFGSVEELLPIPDAEPLPGRRRGGGRPRGGADRADHGPARNPDGARRPDQRRGHRGARADGRRPPQRLPADRPAAARPRLRAGRPQDRRGRGSALPSLRPRADDPRRGAADRDGREHGADGLGADPDRRAGARVHPLPIPALLHGAGRRRPHGGRPAADPQPSRPGDDGLLLRRPDRVHAGSPRRRGTRRRWTSSSASSRRSRRRCRSTPRS